jgi:hypothetical protein
MTAEATENRRKAVKILSVIVVLLSVVVFIPLWLLHRPTDTVTFRFVDADTKEPITDARATCYRRWSLLPLDKLPLHKVGISPWIGWRTTSFDTTNGVVRISHIPRTASEFRIIFSSANHQDTAFSVTEDGNYGVVVFDFRSARGIPYLLPRTNALTVFLRE